MPTKPPKMRVTTAPRQRKPYAWSGGSTRRWRKVRAGKLEDAGYLCEDCGGIATEVHHREHLADGGARLDPANLIALCGECHKARHGAKGCDPSGMPLPGQAHHWNER